MLNSAKSSNDFSSETTGQIKQYLGYAFWGQSSVKVVSAQIPLKDYFFYIFHQNLMKLGMYYHWAIALRKCVRIRYSTPRIGYLASSLHASELCSDKKFDQWKTQ